MPTILKSFNGHTLNSSSYRSAVLNSNELPAAITVFIDEAEADPVDSGTFTVATRNVAVSLRVIDYPNRYTLLSQLKAWLKRGTRGVLVATLEDGADYQLDGRVKSLMPDADDPWLFTAMLESGNTAWRAVTADTDSWDATSTGGTHTLSVGGSDETRLSLTLTATIVPSAGFLYHNLVQLINVPLVNYGQRDICITLDTAALVAAGKMQADGDDLRMFVDGVEVYRWLADMNTNHTHIWFKANLGAGYSLTTRTAIASSGAISSVELAKTASMLTALKTMPASGILVRGTEWISYNGKDLTNYRLTVKQRGTMGTTMQAHGAGSVMSFMEHAIMLYYGNSAMTNPALDDDNYELAKPCFNLSSSDNTKRVGDTTTLFYKDWVPVATKLGDKSKLYNIKGAADTGDPALGMMAAAWLKGAAWQADSVKLGYTYYWAGGIQRISMTGRKYRSGATWIGFSGLQISPDGTTWTNPIIEAAPTVAATWQDWAAHTNVSIANTSRYLFLRMSGASPAVANSYSQTELLTYTIEFTTANIPALSLLGERQNYTLNVRIQNDSAPNVPAIDILYLMQLNKPLTLDGENFTVDYDTVNAHGAMAPDDASRSAWLPLVAGNNIIRVTSPDCGTLHVAASWFKRRL